MIKKIIEWFKAPRFKIGGRLDWEDIEVGEVFGFEGCFNILYKNSEDSAVLLDTDTRSSVHAIGETFCIHVERDEPWFDICSLNNNIYGGQGVQGNLNSRLFALPKETQELYYVK
jgi:hypothetical protein